ncbi:uncharacterized protein LOC118647430 isoform X2 [Monomorium pharaonis]|uniref:uncharacterized protein LOC118647430 isoform X2 n=1 Tax=Monomorium pharaonis TaxID=307658 RepID=UPI001746258D|nr:uncharacterized protein LOC118647430 isoform X2 [Monomorium pharaonis]
MSNRCCAPRCTNSNKNRYALTKLGEDPQLRQKWIDAVGKPNWQPPKLAVLCEVSIEAFISIHRQYTV